jgi:hypothetical protein
MTKTFQDKTLFGISNFGHWKLFDICDLIFVIFELPIKQIPSGDKTKPVHLGQDSLLCNHVQIFNQGTDIPIQRDPGFV